MEGWRAQHLALINYSVSPSTLRRGMMLLLLLLLLPNHTSTTAAGTFPHLHPIRSPFPSLVFLFQMEKTKPGAPVTMR
jgi:hypothetical protein